MGQFIQAKLRVSQPEDKYEQGADRVAEQVMRMPKPQVQRQPEQEQDEEIRRQSTNEEEETVQTRRASSKTPIVSSRYRIKYSRITGG